MKSWYLLKVCGFISIAYKITIMWTSKLKYWNIEPSKFTYIVDVMSFWMFLQNHVILIRQILIIVLQNYVTPMFISIGYVFNFPG